MAARDIMAGEVVAVEQGAEVDRQTVETVELLLDIHSNLNIGRGRYLQSRPQHSPQGGFINHSCDPNAGLLGDRVFIAIRDIAQGDEITCDYSTFEDAAHWEMKCRCGADNCRGTVTFRDYLLNDVQERLYDYFTPYLKEVVRVRREAQSNV